MEIIDVIEADMAKFSHARLHIPRHCKIHHDEVMIEIHRPDVLLFQGKIRARRGADHEITGRKIAHALAVVDSPAA